MAKAEEEKTVCRTPTAGSDGVTRIPSWKYDCVSRAVLGAVQAAGSDGLLFSDLFNAVSERMTTDQRSQLGSLKWHVTTVKLEMEVRGDITRLAGSPQRLIC